MTLTNLPLKLENHPCNPAPESIQTRAHGIHALPVNKIPSDIAKLIIVQSKRGRGSPVLGGQPFSLAVDPPNGWFATHKGSNGACDCTRLAALPLDVAHDRGGWALGPGGRCHKPELRRQIHVLCRQQKQTKPNRYSCALFSAWI